MEKSMTPAACGTCLTGLLLLDSPACCWLSEADTASASR